MGNNFEGFGFDEIFKEALKGKSEKQPTIEDIAKQFKVVLVKCPCCNHTLKIKVKV